MFTKKAICSVLAVMTSISFTQVLAQSTGGEVRAQATSRVDIQALKEADLARRQQLLQQSITLQSTYTQTAQMIAKTQTSIAEAKKQCLEVCTKSEIKGLLRDVEILSGNIVGALVALNVVRTIGGALVGSVETSDDGIRAFAHPLSTWGSRLMYGSAIVLAGANITENFLVSKDKYSMDQISTLELQLGQYSSNLNQIQRNLEVTNKALAQTLKVEQTATVTERTQVYSK